MYVLYPMYCMPPTYLGNNSQSPATRDICKVGNGMSTHCRKAPSQVKRAGSGTGLALDNVGGVASRSRQQSGTDGSFDRLSL